MEQEQIEDLEDFMTWLTEDRHRIYLKYLQKFEEAILLKGKNYRKGLLKDELLSDATIAINDMFEEAVVKLEAGYEEVEKSICFPLLFSKHLTRTIRENYKDNLPHTAVIKEEFRKTVCRTGNKDIYKDYDKTQPVDIIYVNNEEVSDQDYIGSKHNEIQERVKELMHLIAPDESSKVYQDMCDRFVDNKSYTQISKEPRNGGVTKQAIRKRLLKYVESLKFKHRQEEGNEKRI